MTVIIIVRTKTMQVTSGKSQNGFNTDLITTWVRGRRNLVQQITRMKIEFVSLVLALITKSAELIVLPFWSHKIYHADLNSINLVTVYWILVSRQGLSLKFMWAGSHPLPLQQSLFVDCNKSSASKFERPHPLWNNHGCGLWMQYRKEQYVLHTSCFTVLFPSVIHPAWVLAWIFWSTPNGVLMAHTEWLLGVWLRHSSRTCPVTPVHSAISTHHNVPALFATLTPTSTKWNKWSDIKYR